MAGLSTVRLEKDMWTYQLVEPAGVDDAVADASRSFRVFPNPVHGHELRILDASPSVDEDGIWLLSASGRRVAQLSASASVIQIPAHVAAGRYFLSLSAQDGERITRSITVIR
jgi:hypothetical protein